MKFEERYGRVCARPEGYNIYQIAKYENKKKQYSNLTEKQFGPRIKAIANLLLKGKNIEEIKSLIENEFDGPLTKNDLEYAKECVSQIKEENGRLKNDKGAR